MNSKIKNYVDVLFKDIPNTKKAAELKEEILSNLNEHFEEHLKEGKSENQAYTDSLADLGDVDELLKTLEPEKDLKDKIDSFRKVRAKNTSIAVMLYILSIIFVIGFGGIADVFGLKNEELFGIIGVICMFICIAVATGILIYTHMSKPQDVDQYLARSTSKNSSSKKEGHPFIKIYWTLVTVIYFFVSFTTNAWHITWLIWLIGAAGKNALEIFLSKDDVEEKTMGN